MSDPSSLRASVLITNYNYGRFLGYAVDSALAQTWPEVQIVVVDDGSTDHSRALLDSYGDEIQTVYKKNGGQSSAVNAGIPLLTGDAVLLLDSDDMLDPTAIEQSIGFFADPAIVKVHWPMATVDQNGYPTGQIRWKRLPAGDLRETAMKLGPASHTTPSCSANLWRRSFLDAIAPVPTEGEMRNCTDSWLFTLSPFFGTFAALPEPLTFYRKHGNNISTRFAAGPRLANWETRALLLHDWLTKQGERVTIDRWRRRNKYYQRLASIVESEERIGTFLPLDAAVVLVAGQHYDRCDFRPIRPVHRAPASMLDPDRTEADFRAMIDDVTAAGIPYLVVQGPSTWKYTNLEVLVVLLRSEHRLLYEDDWIVIAQIAPENQDGSSKNRSMAAH